MEFSIQRTDEYKLSQKASTLSARDYKSATDLVIRERERERAMQPHEIRYCEYCQKPMERKRYSNGVLQSWNEYNKQKYCNRDCMKAAFKSKPKHGTSWMTIHYHARKLLPDGCCEICGSAENVDVHHKDGNPQNNDLSNLQRLCRSCHMKAHRPHGTCSICGDPEKGLGYCNKHYIRFKKYGDPLMVNGRREVVA